MSRPRKWDDDVMRRQAQNDLRKHLRATAQKEFTGIDGEGTGEWRNHKYVLLGVGNAQISNPGGLRFAEIMEFLWSQFLATPDTVFAGFFLSYDFTQWFRTLPENRARMLLTDAGRMARRRTSAKARHLGEFPVRYAGWEFDVLGMRRFKLRREGAHTWMYINDAGPFFQQSLMSVLDPGKWNDPIVTREEYDVLSEGKARRDGAVLDEDMQNYNRLENDVFARLMRVLDRGMLAAGIRLKRSQWFGPGQAAQEWLGKTDTPSREDIERETEYSVLEAARGAYYGGWFEIMAHGHIPGTTYEYDINSAYPHVASRLPCLLHGKWVHSGRNAGAAGSRDVYRLVRAKVTGSGPRIGAMLHRCSDHSIRRPRHTAGWFWQGELDAARRAGLIDTINTLESWEYIPCDCKPPLRGLAGLYDARIRAGKNSPEGRAYKLIYNSMYGKFAQSVGNPKYANYLYAGLITSGCREMILNAIATHPDKSHAVVMVATDGVYFTSPHPAIPLGNGLGQWEEGIKRNLTLFKPGVYWDDDTRERIRRGVSPEFKARGISAKDFAASIGTIDSHFTRWDGPYPPERDPDGDREGWWPKVRFRTSFSMITAQQALQRGKWFLAGAVTERDVVQDSDPIKKRHSGEFRDGIYWSQPYDGWDEEWSIPYREGEQNDPDEYGITDDGRVQDHMKGILG